jgi:hypothetical protein
VSDQIVRSVRDYVRGRHAPDWPALLTRLRDATESAEEKAFADEVIAAILKHARNPARARSSVRDLLKKSGVVVK